jgi:hypothetical protein
MVLRSNHQREIGIEADLLPPLQRSLLTCGRCVHTDVVLRANGRGRRQHENTGDRQDSQASNHLHHLCKSAEELRRVQHNTIARQ